MQIIWQNVELFNMTDIQKSDAWTDILNFLTFIIYEHIKTHSPIAESRF